MKGFTVREDQTEGVIIVEMHGDFDGKLLSESTAALSDKLRESNCTRALMDHRQATPKLSVVEQYNRPGIAASLGIPRSCRIAIAYQNDHEVYRFIETVGMNHGYPVKVFQDLDEALTWLKR